MVRSGHRNSEGGNSMTPITALEKEFLAAAIAQPSALPANGDGGIPLDFEPMKAEPAPEPKPEKKAKRGPFADVRAVMALLDKNKNGDPQSNLKNAIRLLRFHPAWNVPAPGVLFYDEFSLQICTRNPTPWQKSPGAWTDTDDIRAADWMQALGVIVTPNVARDAVEAVARESMVHPVRDYLKSLTWDKRPRVSNWLSTYLGVDESPLNRALGKKWLVSAIARVMRPGCQADHCLSLEGPQGAGKSSALRILAGDEWFSDHLSDLASKDSRIELLGRWIVELSELAAIRRSDNERVKSFLTAPFDVFRAPYARRAGQVPRQCVFAASFNDSTPFSDPTGNRRFWPVLCGRIDIPKLTQDRNQLWAESYQLFLAGETWWLDSAQLNRDAAKEQSDRVQADPWDSTVLDWSADPQPKTVSDAPLLSKPGQVTVAELLTHAIGKSVDKWDRADEMRVSHILVKSGWRRKRVKLNGWRNQGTWFYMEREGE
jgi:putative DNA primase/helicase